MHSQGSKREKSSYFQHPQSSLPRRITEIGKMSPGTGSEVPEAGGGDGPGAPDRKGRMTGEEGGWPDGSGDPVSQAGRKTKQGHMSCFDRFPSLVCNSEQFHSTPLAIKPGTNECKGSQSLFAPLG